MGNALLVILRRPLQRGDERVLVERRVLPGEQSLGRAPPAEGA